MHKKRYQLIKPVVSHNIYETSSLNRASKKCYRELINLKLKGVETFSIKNIDTDQTYVFKIHKQFIVPQLEQSHFTNKLINQQNITDVDLTNLIHINSNNSVNSINDNNITHDKHNNISNVTVDKKIEIIANEIKNLDLRIAKIEKSVNTSVNTSFDLALNANK